MTVDTALRRLKEELGKRYLGRHGIHGIGVRESEDAICLYVDPGSDLERTPTWEVIRRSAAPHGVVLVREDRPLAR